MSGDNHAASNAGPSGDRGGEQNNGALRRLMKGLRSLTPWEMRRRLAELDRLRTELGDRLERRLDGCEDALRLVQAEISQLRDGRLDAVEKRLDRAEGALAEVSGETERLRDQVLPAVADRADLLLERIAAELDEVGSLTERILRREPLPVIPADAGEEAALSAALADLQPALLETFRGPEAEIAHRLGRYLDALRTHEPVLDLGCGRGELLLLLREAGVASTGIEGDAAVAQAARRRGFDIVEGDVVDALRLQADGSRGAVTAIHLFEHLEPATLLTVLAEVRRVLRPGGLLIAECPNPHSLRVGAALFWIDPTHRRPLMPETLELYMKASGFVVDGRELLHPFPPDELFATGVGGLPPDADGDAAMLAADLERLGRRLDEVVNGSRDFVVWARRPDDSPA